MSATKVAIPAELQRVLRGIDEPADVEAKALARGAAGRMARELEKLREFARDLRDNRDHEESAHRYDTRCVVCEAEKLVGPRS